MARTEMAVQAVFSVRVLAVWMLHAPRISGSRHEGAALYRTCRQLRPPGIPCLVGDAGLESVVLAFGDLGQDQAGRVAERILANRACPSGIMPWHADGEMQGRKLSRAFDHDVPYSRSATE